MTNAASARAKVNLTLHVTGRRDDGYHELDSLVSFADIGDELNFEASRELELSVGGPFARDLLEEGAGNLVLRAAHALNERHGVGSGARIVLTKNLPVAAGLGGGSADAAATLAGLSDMWGLGAAPEELDALALSLGADVPVCLRGRPCVMRGIGERFAPAPGFPELPAVLVNPGRALSTARVFAARSGAWSNPFAWAASYAGASSFIAALAEARNDLESPAIALEPAIGEALRRLSERAGCRLTRMTGSGATCFGLFEDREKARSAAGCLARERPDWWVRACTLAAGDA